MHYRGVMQSLSDIKFILNLSKTKFIKQGAEECEHQEALQKFVLAYRDPKSKEDKILSQIHRSQCGICERHFNHLISRIVSDFNILTTDIHRFVLLNTYIS